MHLKKLILGAFAAWLSINILNIGVFVLLFPEGADYIYRNVRDSQLFQYHIIADLITASLFSVFYAITAGDSPGWRSGLILGIALTLFQLPAQFHIYAMADFPAGQIFLPTVANIFVYGGTGIVVALVHGWADKRRVATQ